MFIIINLVGKLLLPLWENPIITLEGNFIALVGIITLCGKFCFTCGVITSGLFYYTCGSDTVICQLNITKILCTRSALKFLQWRQQIKSNSQICSHCGTMKRLVFPSHPLDRNMDIIPSNFNSSQLA